MDNATVQLIIYTVATFFALLCILAAIMGWDFLMSGRYSQMPTIFKRVVNFAVGVVTLVSVGGYALGYFTI